MSEKKATLYEKTIERWQNSRVVVLVLLCATLFGGLAEFKKNVFELFGFGAEKTIGADGATVSSSPATPKREKGGVRSADILCDFSDIAGTCLCNVSTNQSGFVLKAYDTPLFNTEVSINEPVLKIPDSGQGFRCEIRLDLSHHRFIVKEIHLLKPDPVTPDPKKIVLIGETTEVKLTREFTAVDKDNHWLTVKYEDLVDAP